MFQTIKQVLESLRFAINSLRANRLRSFLSLLGITIGIFIIISVFTTIDSLERSIKSNVASLGNDIIYVQKWPWGPEEGDEYQWWRYLGRPNPSYLEYKQVKDRVSSAAAVAFVLFIGNKTAKYESNSVQEITAFAVTREYDECRVFVFEEGRFFSDSEMDRGTPSVILGYDLAKALFGNKSAVGKKVDLLDRKLTVIGVMKLEGESIINTSMDNNAVISYNFARNIVNKRVERHNPSIMVKSLSEELLSESQYELTGIMRSLRRLKPKDDNNFALNKTSIINNQLEGLFDFIGIVGAIIGAFSVFVGGIGVANIMFVSVKERTSLIGIQKSLGAKSYFILFQFLFEAILLSLIGGLTGILLVYIIGVVVSANMESLTIILTIGNIITGLLISTLIGVFSGILPALQASRMNPVDAIRSNG
ncbi:MAG: putative ABC transport system permease protein [Sphingobacteriales bacterium]|jgi:putative ABC transport system permease protein